MANLSSRPQPKADKTEIKLTAERLMNTSGQTTTLTVKNNLRNRGYLAFQNEISTLMTQIANEQNWNHFHNGQFRIYSLPTLRQRRQNAQNTIQSRRSSQSTQARRISRPPSSHPRSNWAANLLRISLN